MGEMAFQIWEMAAWRSRQAVKYLPARSTNRCATMISWKEGHNLASDTVRLCSSRAEIAPLAGTSSSGEEGRNRYVEFRNQLLCQRFASGQNSFEHQAILAAVVDFDVVVTWIHHP